LSQVSVSAGGKVKSFRSVFESLVGSTYSFSSDHHGNSSPPHAAQAALLWGRPTAALANGAFVSLGSLPLSTLFNQPILGGSSPLGIYGNDRRPLPTRSFKMHPFPPDSYLPRPFSSRKGPPISAFFFFPLLAR